MWLLAFACASHPTPTSTPPAPAPAPEPTLPPEPPAPEPAAAPAPAPDLAGTWRGAPCGARTWERTFTFAADGTYHGRDPISPCPPKARCVWSGVIDFEGRWTVEGGEVVLTEAPAERTDQYRRPARLALADGALVEPDGCRYARSP